MYDYTTVTRERLHGDDKFLSETCTSTDDPGHLRNERVQLRRRVQLLPRCPVNAYFLYTASNAFRPDCTLRRYTAENDRRGPNACVE